MNEQVANSPIPNKDKDSETIGEHNVANTPILEWIIGAVGLIIVTGIVVFLLYQGLVVRNRPPEIQVTLTSVEQIGNQYLVVVRVYNQGDIPAKGLTIEGRLTISNNESEITNLTFDYVPGQSEHFGGMYFGYDPRNYKLNLRAIGFIQP